MQCFSISNIAWPREDLDEVLPLLAERGFSGIEITPSRIWDDFREIDAAGRKAYLKRVQAYGLEICSMHSLFWAAEGMKLFGTKEEQDRLFEYFRQLIFLASDMEIPRMIFGSPPVRNRMDIGLADALDRAGELLRPISDMAFSYGTKILIEPLSASETNFITNHREGLRLADCVGSKGFGLHLDAKAICSEEDDLATVFQESARKYEHFHVNESGLGSLKNPELPHKAIADILRKQNYQGYVSIEMRQLENYSEEIAAAVEFVKSVYGG